MNAFISYFDNVIYVDIENLLSDSELFNLVDRIKFILNNHKTNFIKIRYHNDIDCTKYEFLKKLITTN